MQHWHDNHWAANHWHENHWIGVVVVVAGVGYEALSSEVLPPFAAGDQAESLAAAVMLPFAAGKQAEVLMTAVLPSFTAADKAEAQMDVVMAAFTAGDKAETLMGSMMATLVDGDQAEVLCKTVFNRTGVDDKMLGEATGTLIWHFASGGTRTVTGSFQARNPTLDETSFTREERFDAVIFLPYNDVDGVADPDRDDWLEARGELWDVLSVGSKEGGFRRIELIKTNRVHETAQPIFGRL